MYVFFLDSGGELQLENIYMANVDVYSEEKIMEMAREIEYRVTTLFDKENIRHYIRLNGPPPPRHKYDKRSNYMSSLNKYLSIMKEAKEEAKKKEEARKEKAHQEGVEVRGAKRAAAKEAGAEEVALRQKREDEEEKRETQKKLETQKKQENKRIADLKKYFNVTDGWPTENLSLLEGLSHRQIPLNHGWTRVPKATEDLKEPFKYLNLFTGKKTDNFKRTKHPAMKEAVKEIKNFKNTSNLFDKPPPKWISKLDTALATELCEELKLVKCNLSSKTTLPQKRKIITAYTNLSSSSEKMTEEQRKINAMAAKGKTSRKGGGFFYNTYSSPTYDSYLLSDSSDNDSLEHYETYDLFSGSHNSLNNTTSDDLMKRKYLKYKSRYLTALDNTYLT